uniref:Uncharacterized protein n=1 Tax=Anguilla anguilla TaxID=7936 RepID=A0A0E9VF75_ANGAN
MILNQWPLNTLGLPELA